MGWGTQAWGAASGGGSGGSRPTDWEAAHPVRVPRLLLFPVPGTRRSSLFFVANGDAAEGKDDARRHGDDGDEDDDGEELHIS